MNNMPLYVEPKFFEIVKMFPYRFIIQVGIPVALGLMSVIGGYIGGWLSLKDKYIGDQQANAIELRDAKRVSEINQAFDRINEQEGILGKQKKELRKQQSITENLKQENLKQTEFNQLLKQIQLLSLGAKNGSKKDYNNFYALAENDKLNSELREVWEKEESQLRKFWESELENVTFYRLSLGDGIVTNKWSIEYLYQGINNINRNQKFNNKDVIAFFKEIEISKSKYFIKTLYKIATEGDNISYSIQAAKTLCIINNFEAYPTDPYTDSYKRLVYDIPNFENLKKWWTTSGVKNSQYLCPLDKIIEADRNYYYYERGDEKENSKRLKILTEIIKNFPKLYRTKAEIAYLKLNEGDYSEIEKLAKEVIEGTNAEPLPYLLLSYIGYKQNNKSKMEQNFKLAQNTIGKEKVLRCIQFNSKLHPLLIGLMNNNLID